MNLNFLKPTILILALGGAVSALQIPQLNATAQKVPADQQAAQLTAQAANLKLLKMVPAAGFDNVLADWTFLQFLQYFGDDDARAATDYALSPDFFDAALTHDPYYRYFYLFLSGSSTGYAGMPEKTVSIMEQGLKHLGPQQPADSYYIWRYKGTDELLFLGDGKAAQQSYATAADWASQSSYPGAQQTAQVSQQTAQYLASNPTSKLAQINAWASILTTALDEATQQRAVEHIRDLGGDVIVGEDGGIRIDYAQVEQDAGS